jgi:hypothetical protein
MEDGATDRSPWDIFFMDFWEQLQSPRFRVINNEERGHFRGD